MKKRLLVAALTVACVSPLQAGIPVSVIVDATATQNQFVNYAQALKEYATILDQLSNMRDQLRQAEQDYLSTTGSRNLGDILNDPAFREYLPNNWERIYSDIRTGGYNGLSGSAKALRDASKIYDACASGYATETEKQICNATAVKPAQDQAFAIDAYEKSNQRTAQIESLMREINRTNDPKSIAELNARIQAEQAMLINEQTKLAMYQATAQAEADILRQQETEYQKKMINSRHFSNRLTPVEF
ncbi:attachment mediating protein VirB5-like protein [Vibrio ichthyoenteri ATCC 700023]|uniref:Attachment mediating protein VirB5-like protein n=1 Tax=Vibrio ichthyoenteri ATCC 700023 TaxID=870968 RepID=F9S7R7_9VIBR|nr:P-type DNA transfer protein VirB5 [Vibrio ichthyoenteri]EGU30967.1 attachment mediating protein VirB5-like protein [Vibrio ichthyoenteri ATCC 700023]